MTADLSHGPLTGIRVVDMTVAIQGPHAGAFLADMGADVVKIERPGGELNRYTRHPGFGPTSTGMGTQWVAMNRGKRAICLDVTSGLGREVMRRLVAGADVFLTNYRRDALERMGLGYAQLSADHPELVYARVSGFGPEGPDADKAMLDGAAQARSGIAAISGPADGPPMPPGAAVADHVGAMQLALGVMTALLARERGGRGQEVTTSSLGAMMWAQAWEIALSSMVTEPIRRSGGHNPNILCPYGVYESVDGAAFLFVVAMSDESWDEFWVFGGDPEIVLDGRWNTVAKRIGARGSTDGVEEVRARMRAAFLRHDAAAWEAFFATQPEIIFERVRSYDELLADPQVAANEYVVDVEVPGFGTAKVVTNVVALSETPGGVRRRAPLLAEHNEEVLRELGFGPAEIAEIAAPIAPAVTAIIASITDD